MFPQVRALRAARCIVCVLRRRAVTGKLALDAKFEAIRRPQLGASIPTLALLIATQQECAISRLSESAGTKNTPVLGDLGK